MMNTPICVPCGRSMRCKKNEFHVVSMSDPETPYQIWSGDKYRCPRCGAEVVVGFGRKPISECFAPGFRELMDKLNPLKVDTE